MARSTPVKKKTTKKAPARGASGAKATASRVGAGSTGGAKTAKKTTKKSTKARRPSSAKSGAGSSSGISMQSMADMIPKAVAAAKDFALKGVEFIESHMPDMSSGKKRRSIGSK